MIPRIQKILYATDLSKNSSYAFLYAIDLAQKRDSKIVILHVVEPISQRMRSSFEGYGDAFEKLKDKEQHDDVEIIKKRLNKFCTNVEVQTGTACSKLVSEILVPLGHPVEEILKTADEAKCDLIIMGTHGKGLLKHTFLGSVARSVLDRTRKPIFVIPLPSGKTSLDLGEI